MAPVNTFLLKCVPRSLSPLARRGLRVQCRPRPPPCASRSRAPSPPPSSRRTRFKEKAEFNQYWYSQGTIDALVKVQLGGKLLAPPRHPAPPVTQQHLIVARTSSFSLRNSAPQEILAVATKAAFLSTPSVYFSLPQVRITAHYRVRYYRSTLHAACGAIALHALCRGGQRQAPASRSLLFASAQRPAPPNKSARGSALCSGASSSRRAAPCLPCCRSCSPAARRL